MVGCPKIYGAPPYCVWLCIFFFKSIKYMKKLVYSKTRSRILKTLVLNFKKRNNLLNIFFPELPEFREISALSNNGLYL